MAKLAELREASYRGDHAPRLWITVQVCVLRGGWQGALQTTQRTKAPDLRVL